MGIPLAAEGLRPVQQPEDPLSQYGKVLSIKSMMAQQQLIPGQVQEQQIEIQRAQQQQKDQQAMTAAMQAWDGKDYNQLPGLVLKHGGSAQSVLGLKSSLLKQQQDLAGLDKDRLENEATKNNLFSGLIDQVKSSPPEQRPQSINGALQRAAELGVDQQQLQQFSQLAQAPIDQQNTALDFIQKGLIGHKQLIDEASKQQADAIARAEEERKKALQPSVLSKAESEAAMAQAKAQAMQGGALPEDMAKAKYQKVLTDLEAKRPVTPDDLNFAKAYEAAQAKTSSTIDTLGIKSTNISRPSGLASVGAGRGASGGQGGAASGGAGAPGGGNLIDLIGNGRVAPDRLGYLLAREPRLMQAVAVKYPDIDTSKLASYPHVYQNFTSGKVSVQLNSGSTALRHLAELKQINDENPNEVRIPNTAANKAYNNLLDTVADELNTFYGEPKTNEAMASKKATLGGLFNRDAAISQQAKAMGDKFDELENTWKNAAPSAHYEAPMPGYSDASKKARAYLDPNYKYAPSTTTQAAPQAGRPKIGTLEDGYIYTGGDPADKSSWKKR